MKIGNLYMRLGWICRRLAPVVAALVAILSILILMLRWGFICTNLHTIKHVNNLCMDHLIGEAVGNLCEPLCIEESMESFSCHTTNRPEGIMFSADWMGKRIFFKTPKRTALLEYELIHWTDENNVKNYPSHNEFIAMIKNLVLKKINITLSNEDARELSHLPGEYNRDEKKITRQRKLVMDNVWMLLQDDEYLFTVLFENKNVFPKRVGTCGSYYAVEHADVIKSTSTFFSLEENDEEWTQRTQTAALFIDLLVKLDNAQLQLCDVQLKHFGSKEGHLNYLSPDKIRRRGSLPVNKPCKQDYDCGYMDCRANCNLKTGRCDRSIESDNLQMVCEKIYLGWTAAGRVILPGLLVSTKASSALAALLRQCADPHAAPHSQTFRDALYNTLIRKS